MNAEPDSILDKVLGNRPKQQARPAPTDSTEDILLEREPIEPEDVTGYQGFSAVTKRLAADQFELRSQRGNSRLIEYHTLLGADFHPSHGLVLTCVHQKILMRGKQLRQLVRDFRNHQVMWVQELKPERLTGASDPNATVVTSIHIYAVGHDRTMTLDEAIDEELRLFDEPTN